MDLSERYNGPLAQALGIVRKLMCSEGGRQIIATEIVEPFGYEMVSATPAVKEDGP